MKRKRKAEKIKEKPERKEEVVADKQAEAADETSEVTAAGEKTSKITVTADEMSEVIAAADETSEVIAAADETSEVIAAVDETSEITVTADETSEIIATAEEAPEENTRTIEVVLSRDRSAFSWFTYFMDGGGLTHASIAFDEDADHYYSFNFRGFKREYKTSLMKRPREIKRYKLMVTEEQYQALKTIIEDMEKDKSRYSYAKADVSLCLFKLPRLSPDNEEAYFCSEFVARVLDQSGCLELPGDYRTYTPNDIANEIEKSGRVKEVIQDSSIESPVGKAIDKTIGAVEKGKNLVVEMVRDQIDSTMEEASGFTPFIVKVGVGTIDKFETIYHATASLAQRMKSQVNKLPGRVAKGTGGVVNAVSGVADKVVKVNGAIQGKLEALGEKKNEQNTEKDL